MSVTTKRAADLSPGDEIVVGHVFPRTFYTGTVIRVEDTGEANPLFAKRVVCEGAQWRCAEADEFQVKVIA